LSTAIAVLSFGHRVAALLDVESAVIHTELLEERRANGIPPGRLDCDGKPIRSITQKSGKEKIFSGDSR
jgi:hypothetical protein